MIYTRDEYEAEIGFAIVIIIYFLSELNYFILFNLSTENYFNTQIAIPLWKFSIFSRIFSVGLLSSIHGVELHKHSKIRFLGIITYFFIEGVIISLLLFPNIFLILQEGNNYKFYFNNIELLVFVISFNILVIFFFWISQLKGYVNFNDKKLGQFFFIYISILTLNIAFYSIYLITFNLIFKNLHIISYIINSAFALFVIIKKPALFLVFTNKIYDFIIFHKSGILLYSYNFETSKEVDETLLKGSILIGINHILASFSGVENKLNHIKMSDKGVIFNFNIDLGYAILLIARHKNKILEKAVKKFIKRFSENNRENLTKLTGLIDVSIFKNTGKLVKECFRKYIAEN